MSNPRLRTFGAFAAGLCLLGVSAAQDSSMSPEEIKKAWVDKKVFSRASSGAFMDFVIRSNGTAEVAAANWADTGTWRLSDNGYCVTWKTIRAGTERCFTVVKRGSSMVVLNPDLSISAEVLKVVE